MYVLNPSVETQVPVVRFLSLGSRIRAVVMDQFFLAESCNLLTMWKPRSFASLWHGMSIIRTDVSHGPIASALDFPISTFAPDVSSKQCNASCILGMSVGHVAKIVTSSA